MEAGQDAPPQPTVPATLTPKGDPLHIVPESVLMKGEEEEQGGNSIALNLFRHLIGFLHCTHSLFYKGHFYKGHCLILGKIKGQSILLAHKIRDKIVHADKGH